MGDPNWLYSSVVQSTAAIVAVVGAFVTSTVINLSTKRENLREHISKLTSTRSVLQNQSSDLRIRSEVHRIWFYLEQEFDKIYHLERPFPAADQVKNELGYSSFTDRAFAQAWGLMIDNFKKHEAWLQSKVDQFTHLPSSDVDDWVELHDIEITGLDHSLLEFLYRELYLERVPPKPRSRSYYESSFDPSLIAIVPSDSQRIIEDSHRSRMDERNQRETDSLRAEAERIELEIERLDDQLKQAREDATLLESPPRNIIMGFACLAFLAIAGIAVPLALMPQSHDSFAEWHKWLVIILFSLGVASLFVYMAVLLFPSVEERLFRHTANRPGQPPADVEM